MSSNSNMLLNIVYIYIKTYGVGTLAPTPHKEKEVDQTEPNPPHSAH